MLLSTHSCISTRSPTLVPDLHSPSATLQLHRCRHAQHLHLLSARQCSSGSSSNSSRLVCSAGPPRPMWAAKAAPEPPPPSNLAAIVTRRITAAKRFADLQAVVKEWGDSFNYSHTAAALVKFSKLPYSQRKQRGGSKLLQLLFDMWRSQLQLAGEQACADVLGACSRLEVGRSVDWDSTWQAFIKHCQRACADTAAAEVKPQNVSNALLAAAELWQQPTAEELQLLLQLLLRPDVLDQAPPQRIANIVWALGRCTGWQGWQGGVSEQQVQLLLGEQQVRQLGMEGTPQNISNVVLSLARMVTGKTPLLSKAFAKATTQQLLDAAVQRKLSDWSPYDITKALRACDKMQLSSSDFLAAAAAAAPSWLPWATDGDLLQTLWECRRLHFADAEFMQQLLQQGVLVCQRLRAKPQSAEVKSSLNSLAGEFCGAVVELDMQVPQVAEAARDVVVASGINRRRASHSFYLGTLWVFHDWSQRHGLLKGKGLRGAVTKLQLQQGLFDKSGIKIELLPNRFR